MEGDPNGVVVATAAPDTAATADAALATSEPTVEATRAAEGQGSESTEQSATTPDDTASAEDSVETEGSDTESEDDQPRNDEERKLSRRERQRLREQERIDKAIADALAAKEREREQAEETRKRQEQAEAAQKARQDRLSQFVGTPDTLKALDREIDDLNRQIRSELMDPRGADLDGENGLIAQVNAKTAQRDRWTEAQSFQGEIEDDIWSRIESDFAYPTTFPEMSDPQSRAAYLHAQGGIRGGLDVLANAIRSHKDREWQGKLDAQAKDFQTKLKAAEADRDGWRARAGGGTLAPEDAGAPATDGLWTRERLARLTPAEYRKHRESIARAEAAGQIR